MEKRRLAFVRMAGDGGIKGSTFNGRKGAVSNNAPPSQSSLPKRAFLELEAQTKLNLQRRTRGVIRNQISRRISEL